MIDLEEKARRQEKLEKKRRKIAEEFKKGKSLRELANEYNMSTRGIQYILSVCIAYGYISEKEYQSHAKAHMGARNFKRGS